jgi:hypothetical protein
VSNIGSNSAAFRIDENIIFCLHLMHGGDSLFDSRKPESVTIYFAPQWSHFQGTCVGRDGRNMAEVRRYGMRGLRKLSSRKPARVRHLANDRNGSQRKSPRPREARGRCANLGVGHEQFSVIASAGECSVPRVGMRRKRSPAGHPAPTCPTDESLVGVLTPSYLRQTKVAMSHQV